MAITVAHKKQTPGGSANSSIKELTAATKGRLLVAFISIKASEAAPTLSDNLGSTGWTVQATKATWSGNSLWCAVKTAVGGETEIKVAGGSEGALVQGISYWELAGASETLDGSMTHLDSQNEVKGTTPAVTTTNGESVILAAVGSVANTGAISAWTGTGPMENNEPTTSSRGFSGVLIPGTTETGVTFTANWTTKVAFGMLTVAFVPAIVGAKIVVHGGGAVTRTAEVAHIAEPRVHGGGNVTRTSHVGGENRVAVTGGGKTVHTPAVFITVHGGGSVARTTERAPDPGMPKIVQRGKSGTAGVSSIKLGSTAVSGNLLIAFVADALSATSPVVTDDLGATWTPNETRALFGASGANLTLYTKRASGGETEIKVSEPAGIAYYEVERCRALPDVILHVDNQKSTTSTFAGFSTTSSRDLIIGAWGLGGPSGEVKPWTGTGPLTFINSTSTRVISGALVPETTLKEATFTANWTSTANNGGLIVAFLAAGVIRVNGGGATTRTAFVQQGTSTHRASTQGKVTETGEVLLGTPLIAVHGGGNATHRGSTATHLVHGGGLTRRTSSAIIGSVARRAHGGGRSVITSFYTPGVISHHVTGGGNTSATKGNAISVSGGGRSSHERFTGPPMFPSNAPVAGRAAAVHTGRVEALTR